MGQGLINVELDHPPQARVADTDDAGYGQQGHLPNQSQGRLLEQQGEPATFAGPWSLDASGPMIGAVHPRHTPGDVAVILEDVEVAR